MKTLKGKDFLKLLDFSSEEIIFLICLSEKLKAMKKSNEITEDDQTNGEKKIQTLTDKFCKEIDDSCAAKEKEIMEI